MVAANRSAGILPYRMRDTVLEVFIGHMGGPFWAKKDARAWSVIKGLIEPGETELAAALREFAEETGNPAPAADYALLGEFRQSSGKRVTVFTAEIDELPPFVTGSTFELEWPPHSGRVQSFAEIDDVRWFTVGAAEEKLVKGQLPVLEALTRR
jgi:predicted NUDIX family NTP pyrophosphohydrolase